MVESAQQSEWTRKRLLEWTSDYLGQVEVDQPRLCAEILLAETLGCQRIELYTNFNECPDAEQLAHYRDWVRRCAAHEPVAYLVGKAHFYSLELAVGPTVLIPRPETEVLVTEAIDLLRQTIRPTVDVLDLCTGSGCVAIAIAANIVEAEVAATDKSADAIQLAQRNVQGHDLQGRVTLWQSDLFANIEQSGKAVFDLIVSNPPYIATGEFAKLPANIRQYEPREALLAGEDGLDVIRRIVSQAEPYLADNAMIMLEIGHNQAQQVTALFEQCGYLNEITTVEDNLGHQRVVKARK